jgi:hypothetical protein
LYICCDYLLLCSCLLSDLLIVFFFKWLYIYALSANLVFAMNIVLLQQLSWQSQFLSRCKYSYIFDKHISSRIYMIIMPYQRNIVELNAWLFMYHFAYILIFLWFIYTDRWYSCLSLWTILANFDAFLTNSFLFHILKD